MSEIAFGSPEYETARELRNEILRQPLGLDLYQENSDWEKRARHFVMYRGERLVACLIAFPESHNCYRIRQLATRPDCRGQGFGSELMRHAETELTISGATNVILHARVSAVGFYEKLGYQTAGREFEEVTVPHVRMEKSLGKSSADPGPVKVEACIRGDTPAEASPFAAAAFRGGADTVELCSAMHLEGLSPSIAAIKAARAEFRRPGLMTMVRPRDGDFCYSDEEFEIVERQIESAAKAGADGVVFGLLTNDGHIDDCRVKRWVAQSRQLGLKTTFHRAFDATPSREEALATLIELGVDRILTSGVGWGEPGSALDGVLQLDRLIQQSAGRIEIIIGGGVSPECAPAILESLNPWTGTLSVHAYSGVMEKGETSEERVRALVEAVSAF